MSKKILSALPELTEAKVISLKTAEAIRQYYKSRGQASPNRMILAFGILGAILVGLGIILIIAHNWDELSRPVKTVFAFLPLVVGQILSGYALVKKNDSSAWRESSAAFLFFAVGAAISLASQIYNIPGNFGSFMATWMFATLPVVYLLRSGITSLLYIIGITAFVCVKGYFDSPIAEPYVYWLLLALVLPYYYRLMRKNPAGNFTVFHHWLVPLSVTIALGTIANHFEEYMFLGYMSLFGLFYLAGKSRAFRNARLIANPYLILGALGSLTILLMLSFDWFWRDLVSYGSFEGLTSIEMFVSGVLFLASALLWLAVRRKKGFGEFDLLEISSAIFAIAFFTGFRYVYLPVLLINLTVFCAGILLAIRGARLDRLDLLNFGLMVIAVLIVCRFFDVRLAFVLRGILFVTVGLGFFLANYLTLKNRKIKQT